MFRSTVFGPWRFPGVPDPPLAFVFGARRESGFWFSTRCKGFAGDV